MHNRVVNPPIVGQQAQGVHAENPPIENHDGANGGNVEQALRRSMRVTSIIGLCHGDRLW